MWLLLSFALAGEVPQVHRAYMPHCLYGLNKAAGDDTSAAYAVARELGLMGRSIIGVNGVAVSERNPSAWAAAAGDASRCELALHLAQPVVFELVGEPPPALDPGADTVTRAQLAAWVSHPTSPPSNDDVIAVAGTGRGNPLTATLHRVKQELVQGDATSLTWLVDGVERTVTVTGPPVPPIPKLTFVPAPTIESLLGHLADPTTAADASYRALLHRGPTGDYDGFRLSGMTHGGSMDALGFKAGDVVHTVNGHSLTSFAEAGEALKALQAAPPDTLLFELTRRGERVELEVVTGG